MKRLIIILGAALLLTACGSKVHKNIDEGLVVDAEQILTIFDDVNETGREITDKEVSVFDHFRTHYGDDKDFTEEERRLIILTNQLTETPVIFTMLATDKERYEKKKKTINKVIKTGKIN